MTGQPAAPSSPARKRSLRSARAVDLRKIFADDYRAEAEPRHLRIPAAKYLTLSPLHTYTPSRLVDQMQRLYDVGFAVKTNARMENPRYRRYTMAMVEVLAWPKEPGSGIFFVSSPREAWAWQLILRTPAFVLPSDLQSGLEALERQGKKYRPDEVKLQVLDEGECVQLLVVGQPVDDLEAPIRAKKFARARNLVLTGVQHEIFLTNVLHARPAMREVIYRFPVVPHGTPGGTPVPHGPRFK